MRKNEELVRLTFQLPRRLRQAFRGRLELLGIPKDAVLVKLVKYFVYSDNAFRVAKQLHLERQEKKRPGRA